MGNCHENRERGLKSVILAADLPRTSLLQETRAAECEWEGRVAQSAARRRESHRREHDHRSLRRGARFKVTLTRYPGTTESGREGTS
jgi:hypothetical protein